MQIDPKDSSARTQRRATRNSERKPRAAIRQRNNQLTYAQWEILRAFRAVAAKANKHTDVEIPHAEVMAIAKCSERTLQRAIPVLVRERLLVRTYTPRASARFTREKSRYSVPFERLPIRATWWSENDPRRHRVQGCEPPPVEPPKLALPDPPPRTATPVRTRSVPDDTMAPSPPSGADGGAPPHPPPSAAPSRSLSARRSRPASVTREDEAGGEPPASPPALDAPTTSASAGSQRDPAPPSLAITTAADYRAGGAPPDPPPASREAAAERAAAQAALAPLAAEDERRRAAIAALVPAADLDDAPPDPELERIRARIAESKKRAAEREARERDAKHSAFLTRIGTFGFSLDASNAVPTADTVDSCRSDQRANPPNPPSEKRPSEPTNDSPPASDVPPRTRR